MKVHAIPLNNQEYQEIHIPNGAAPLTVAKSTDNDWADYMVYYLGPDLLSSDQNLRIGVYIFKTGGEIPDAVRVFPQVHPLTRQQIPPNARYVGTIGNRHVFFGDPRVESEKLVLS